MGEESKTSIDLDAQLSGPGARCLVGPDGRVRDANDAWFSRTALARERVLGRDVIELFPEARSLFMAVHARVRSGHEVFIPMHAERIAHREFWWAGRVSPVAMEDGPGSLIVMSECVEGGGEGRLPRAGRLTVEDPKILERYSALVETATEMVCWTNERGEATNAASSWSEFTGQTVEEGRGYGWLKAIHPEDLPRTLAVWKAARETDGRSEVEYRLRRYDGAWRTVVARSIPVRGDDDRLQGHITTITDITDRREAEEALREAARKSERNRAKLEAILQAMREGVFVLDMSGAVVFANDAEARMFGLKGASELMQKVAKVSDPAAAPPSTPGRPQGPSSAGSSRLHPGRSASACRPGAHGRRPAGRIARQRRVSREEPGDRGRSPLQLQHRPGSRRAGEPRSSR